MAKALKMPGVTLGTTKTPVLVCAAGAQIAATDLVLFNPSGAARTADLFFWRQADGIERSGPAGITLAAGTGQYRFPANVYLEPGDEIRARADAAGAVTVFVSHAVLSAATPLAKAFNPRGAYSGTATYATNDVVSQGGSSYISMQDGNVGHPPDTSPTYWMVSALQGLQGSAGTPATTADARALTNAERFLTPKTQADAIATFSLGNITGTLALDLAVAGFNPSGIATGNLTLGQHTNVVDQKPVSLEIVQDGTGSRTLAVNTTYNKFIGGTPPTLSTAPNARDILYGTGRIIGGVMQVHWTGFAKDVK